MNGAKKSPGFLSRLLSRFKKQLLELKRQAIVVWCLARHRLTPLTIKLLALSVAAYAFSPIDLIPDFIPVLGILDDLIIVPLGIYTVLRLSPPDAVRQARQQAGQWLNKGGKPPQSRFTRIFTATIILLIWLLLAVLFGIYLIKFMQ